VIKLPRTVVSQNYIALFGLKKQVYAGYPASFTIRVEYTENLDDKKCSNTLELNIRHTETGDLIPLSVHFDDTNGDYVVQFHAPNNGTVEVTVDLRVKKLIPPLVTEEVKKTEEPRQPVKANSFISGAMKARMAAKALKKKQAQELKLTEVEVVPAAPEEPSSPVSLTRSELPAPGSPTSGSPTRGRRDKSSPRLATAPWKMEFPSEDADFADDGNNKFQVSVFHLFGGVQPIEVLQGVVDTVGPEGGTIKLVDGELTIPEGALDKEVEISCHFKPCCASTYKRGFNSVTVRSGTLTLMPNDITFAKKCALTMQYRDNSRYPKPSIGRLCLLWWHDESSQWQELGGGKFSKGTAVVQIGTLGMYAVATAAIMDASLMPVVVNYANKAELLSQARLSYSNLLPHQNLPPGIGGHMLLVQFSMLKDKRRDDKHIYPPASLGFYMDGCRKDGVHWHAVNKKIDILALQLNGADKELHFKVVNKTSQPLQFIFEKGIILEQTQSWGHQHVIVAKDQECKLRGLQEATYKLAYFDMTDMLVPPTKTDDMAITPFTIDKAFLANEKKVYAYIASKLM